MFCFGVQRHDWHSDGCHWLRVIITSTLKHLQVKGHQPAGAHINTQHKWITLRMIYECICLVRETKQNAG